MADESGTSWTSIVYIGITLLGYFAVKGAGLTQSGYQQISLDNWKPLSKEEKLKLGIV
jgi:hypothetical protein